MATTTLKLVKPQVDFNLSSTPAPNEFDSKEFEAGRESLPYLQMLNHQDSSQAGFFITSDNMEAVGFTPTDEWTLHSTTFQNGQTVEGFRSLVARFLILRKSKLLIFDRESGEFLSEYKKSLYDRAAMVLKVRYLVYLVNQQKQLLHETPLLFTTKGSVCGSFGDAVKDFHNDMSKAYGAATGAKKPRGERFMALSVLAVRVQPELKGDKKKSWVCSVASYGSPTSENWRSYFVGYDEAVKAKILAEVDESKDFGVSEREFEGQQKSSQIQTHTEPGLEHDNELAYDLDEDF